MNTQKQIFLIVALSFVLVGGCAAYTAIDLPIRAGRQADFFESESIERGALLFANNCRTCHGITGEGGVGPALNRDEFRDQDPLTLANNQELIRTTLTCGRAGTLMPAWVIENGGSLTSHQIEHFVRLFTFPEEPVTIDGEEFVNDGWAAALEFGHNLNGEASALVAGDTLASIAARHNIGPREVAEANGVSLDATFDQGDEIELPSGETYKVLNDGTAVKKVAENNAVGPIILAELNGLDYFFGDGTFYLTTDGSDSDLIVPFSPNDDHIQTGLIPGSTLELPGDLQYTVAAEETLNSIAEAHALDADDIVDLNDILDGLASDVDIVATLTESEDLAEGEDLVIRLPDVDAYMVVGQDLAAVSSGFSNVTAASLAEANELEADGVYPIGKQLHMPEDAWGSAPPDTLNDGTACIEHAVPDSTFTTLPGVGEPTEVFDPEQPENVSEDVTIVAHANDWTVEADGETQDPNMGVVLVDAGTTVNFRNDEGLHTIEVEDAGEDDGEQQPNFMQGDSQDVVFDTAGEFDILCFYHPDMFARVFVQ